MKMYTRASKVAAVIMGTCTSHIHGAITQGEYVQCTAMLSGSQGLKLTFRLTRQCSWWFVTSG